MEDIIIVSSITGKFMKHVFFFFKEKKSKNWGLFLHEFQQC